MCLYTESESLDGQPERVGGGGGGGQRAQGGAEQDGDSGKDMS